MVKMASKDSGTGNSVESSRSNGSKEGDFIEGGSTTSTIDVIKRKPLLKQASTGMVGFCFRFCLTLWMSLYGWSCKCFCTVAFLFASWKICMCIGTLYVWLHFVYAKCLHFDVQLNFT